MQGTPEYWQAVSEEWQDAQTYSLWRQHSDAVNAAWVSQALPPGTLGHVLKTDLFDEAFGAGLYPALAARATRVSAIDVSSATVAAACRRYSGLQAIQADVRHLPFDDGIFDAVISNSTLDHFSTEVEIVASLRELHRVLGRGGRLLLSLDNPANPAIALRNALPFGLLKRLGVVPYYVGVTYGPRRVQVVLRRIGFEVLEIGGLLHCTRLPAVAATRLLEHAQPRTQKVLLRWLRACEDLGTWPTALLTGHYLTVTATKREGIVNV